MAYKTFTSTIGQTSFAFPGPITDKNDILVFINGVPTRSFNWVPGSVELYTPMTYVTRVDILSNKEDGSDEWSRDLDAAVANLKGDGISDDTAAMQAAINLAMLTKATLVIPNGWYKLGAITIDGKNMGVNIIGEGWNSNLAESPEQGGVVFELISGTHASMFTVGTECAPIHFENIFFRGNQAGQTTGTSWAVDFVAATSAKRSGSFYRCRIERFRSGGVRVGTFRDAGKMDLCVFLNNGFDFDATPLTGDGIQLASCNDWRFSRIDTGANSRHGMYIVGGGTVLGTQCNFFSNLKTGMTIDASAMGVNFSLGSFDRNLREGLVIVGNASATKAHVRSFTDYLFSGNGVETDNTYSDIRIANEPNGFVQITNPVFSRGGSANKNKYCVEATGTTAGILVVQPRYRTDAEAPYGTSFASSTTLIRTQGRGASFHAHKNAVDQTDIAASGVPTKLTFGTEAWDVLGLFDAATNHRWTPPQGLVRLTAAANFTAGIVTDTAYTIMIYKNGALYKTIMSVQASGTGGLLVSGSVLDNASGTDYYEVFVAGGGAGTKTVAGAIASTYFQGDMVA